MTSGKQSSDEKRSTVEGGRSKRSDHNDGPTHVSGRAIESDPGAATLEPAPDRDRTPAVALQRRLGNGGVQRLARRALAGHLEIGDPEGEYEREAERMANRLLSGPENAAGAPDGAADEPGDASPTDGTDEGTPGDSDASVPGEPDASTADGPASGSADGANAGQAGASGGGSTPGQSDGSSPSAPGRSTAGSTPGPPLGATGQTGGSTAASAGRLDRRARADGLCDRCQGRLASGQPLNCQECEAALQRKVDVSAASGAAAGVGADQDGRGRDGTLDRSTEPARTGLGGGTTGAPGQGSAGGGQPLDTRVQAELEPRVEGGLDDVRVHDGPDAARAARAVNARAFTIGRDIVFGEGEYRPGTRSGRELIAHEVAHVLQGTSKLLRNGQQCPRNEYSEGEPVNLSGRGYLIMATWTGDLPFDRWVEQLIDRWVTYRFGHGVPSAARAEIIRELSEGHQTIAQPEAGCQYGYNIYDRGHARAIRIVEKYTGEEEEEADSGGGRERPPSGPGEPPESGETKEREGEREGTPRPGREPEESEKAEESRGGGLRRPEVSEEAREAMRKDRQASALRGDRHLLVENEELADRYLMVLNQYDLLASERERRRLLRDGLSAEELTELIEENPFRGTLADLFTQGYREFQDAGGSGVEEFFRLEQTIVEQFIWGNPTASYNLLKIGRGRLPHDEGGKEVLGIVHRETGLLLYKPSGFPVRSIAGVGFRDEGYVGARQEPGQRGINIANIADAGLRSLLNTLRQEIGDPMKATGQAAEILFENVELVKKRVVEGLSEKISEELQKQLPFLVGFLAGQGLTSLLIRSGVPALVAIGGALKSLLSAAGYILNIEAGIGLIQRLHEAATYLIRVRAKEGGELPALSEHNLEQAAGVLRQILAELVIEAPMLMLDVLSFVRSGRGSARIDCSNCDVDAGTGKVKKRLDAERAKEEPGSTREAEEPEGGREPAEEGTAAPKGEPSQAPSRRATSEQEYVQRVIETRDVVARTEEKGLHNTENGRPLVVDADGAVKYADTGRPCFKCDPAFYKDPDTGRWTKKPDEKLPDERKRARGGDFDPVSRRDVENLDDDVRNWLDRHGFLHRLTDDLPKDDLAQFEKAVARYKNVPGFRRVVTDFLASENKRKGARFVIRRVNETVSDADLKYLQFESADKFTYLRDGKRAETRSSRETDVRRFELGLRIELKNWSPTTFKKKIIDSPGQFRQQFQRDVSRIEGTEGGMRWEFNKERFLSNPEYTRRVLEIPRWKDINETTIKEAMVRHIQETLEAGDPTGRESFSYWRSKEFLNEVIQLK